MGRNLFRIIGGGFFAGAALASSGALADDPAPVLLKPSSKWHVDYADDTCRLARVFGEGEQKAIVYFERYEPGDDFFLLVAGAPLAHPRADARTSFRFGPVGREYDNAWASGSLDGFEPALIVSRLTLVEPETRRKWRFNPDAIGRDTDVFGQTITPEQERAVEWLEVRRGTLPPVRFLLGSMGEPLRVMRACTDEMMVHWGIDLEAHRRLSRAVAPLDNPGDWMSYKDYPAELLRQRKVGLVQFRLSVSAEGKPTQCHIQNATKPEDFERAVCDGLMSRARFRPALDEQGSPIASYWRNAVIFNGFGR